MILDYINAAMQRAKYELLPDEKKFYGEIKECQGVWAEGKTLEACRSELMEVLEEWIILKLKDGDKMPVIGNIDINIKQVA